MKMKRFIAGFLSLVMMIGMLGTVDVNAAESAYGTEIASNLADGTFTDDSADVNEDYVYTVVGSDGSVAEISTDAYDDIAEGYWKLQWNTSGVNAENGEYLIVSANINKAVKSIENAPYGEFEGNNADAFIAPTITTNSSVNVDEFKWNITKSGNKYLLESYSKEGYYMKVTDSDAGGGANPVTVATDGGEAEIVASYGNGKMDNAVFIKHNGGYWNYRGNDYVGTWDDIGTGNCFYLYKKGYRVLEEALQKVTNEVVGTEWDYSIDTWNAYNDALAEVYTSCDSPSEALEEFNALVAAKDALEVLKTKSVYKKLEGVEKPESGNYLIVMERNRDSKGTVANVPAEGFNFSVDKLDFIVEGKTTSPVEKKYVWTITKEDTEYTVQDQAEKYIDITGNGKTGASLISGKAKLKIVWLEDNLYEIGKGDNYLNVFNDRGAQLGTYNVSGDGGNKLYLYADFVTVTDLAIANTTKNVGTAEDYTTASWTAYQEALDAAKIEYASKAEAETALDKLIAAKEALKPSEVESVFKKLTEGAAVDTGKYLIVTADRNVDSALANHVGTYGKQFAVAKPVYSADGTVRNIESKYVWLITKKADNSGYTIQDTENKYLYIENGNSQEGLGLVAAENVGSIAADKVTMQIPVPDSTGRLVIGNGSQYLHCYNYDDWGIGTYSDKNDSASNFYLYGENFAVKTEILDGIEDSVGSESDYTNVTLNAYKAALAEAEKSYSTKADAETALAELREAVAALVEIDYSVLKLSFDRYDIDDTKTPLVEDGIYAIVGAHYDANYGGRQSQNKAIKNGGGFMYEDLGNGPGTAAADNVYDSIPENKLQNSNVYEWEFKSISETQNTYHVKSVQMGTYMQIRDAVTLQNTPSVITIRRDDNIQGNTTIYRELGGIILGNDVNNKVLNHQDNAVGIWSYQEGADNNNHGNTYYLYKKQYRIDTSGLEALVDPNGVYDEAAKLAYDNALTEARNAVGNAGVVYEKYLALEEATNHLVSTMVEGIIHAAGLTAPTGWTKNTASMDAKLTLGASTLVKTDKALVFNLLDASAFELLATCGNNTGMVMAVVKDANGKTLRSYLVDTYYDVTTPEVNVPIVRDMMLKGGETVDVYACLVANVIGNRKVSTMSVRGRAVEVTTDDIVMALLEELGLENELDVADVNVSYMSEDSVLKGGTSSSINTYAVAPMSTGNAENDTEYTVSVQGCRIYKPTDGVEYKALSDLVADEKTAFISKGGTEFVLAEYQKTGPQNEIYLAQNESIVIGLASAPSADYFVSVTAADGTRSYRELEFKQVEGEEEFAATIENKEADEIALGMIKMSSVSGDSQASPSFVMTNAMAKAVLAVMNADADVVVNPFEDVTEDTFFYDAVLWALDEKITKGVSETLFAPDRDCTRAEVVTFLWRAAGKPEATDVESKFVDVVEGSFYEDAVLWAVENGITKGRSEKEFRPNDACTRAEVVTFLWRAAGRPEAADAENKFVDVVEGSFYEDAVLWAVENRITKGVNAECFAPNDGCVRGQVVTFLYRAMSE